MVDYHKVWEEKKKLIDQFIREPDFLNTEIFISPGAPFLRTNNFIQQTLSRLLGWNQDNKEWRALRVTNDGRLYITSQPQTVSTLEYTQVAVDTSAVQIKAANTNRRAIIIKNIADTNIYLGSDSAVTVNTGFLLSPGEALMDELYVGAWYAISDVAGGKVAIIEM